MEEEQIILFEKYLSNALSSSERAEFDQRIQQDVDFKEDFELFQKMDHFLAHKDVKTERKEQLRKLSAENNLTKKKEEETKKTFNWKLITAIVLGLLLLALAAFYFMNRNLAPPQYADYAIHNTISLQEMSSTTTDYSLIEELYNSKDYTKALAEINKLNESDLPVELLLTKAICYIETNEHTKGENILLKIYDGDSIFKNEAAWYLALANLKLKKYEVVKRYLTLIPKGSFRYDSAVKMLSKM